LGEIDPGNETAINALVELLQPNPNEDEYIKYTPSPRGKVAESLGRIDPGNEKAIATLVELIESTDAAEDDEWEIASEAVSSLGEIGTGNEKAISTLIKLIQNGWDEDELVAETLGKIDPGNEIAITTLVKLILDGGDEDEIVANSLEQILQGAQYPKVVTALKNYMMMRFSNTTATFISTNLVTMFSGVVPKI
jgi:HEAT repeat protein